MKRGIFLLTLLMFVFLACEGPEGPKGDQGEPGNPGESGPSVPVINTIVATPAVINLNQSTTVTLSYAYGGVDTVDIAWTAASGTIDGEGTEVNWTAPSEAGYYLLNVVLTAGDKTSTGAISILVTEDGEDVAMWTGFVYDEDETALDGATVWEGQENFTTALAGGGYEMFSTVIPGNLSAYKEGFEVTTIKGFNSSPDFYLRDGGTIEPATSHWVTVNLEAMWEPDTSDNIVLRVSSTNGGTTGRISFGAREGRFEYTCSLLVPEGETHIYAVINNRQDCYFAEEFVNLTSDIEIDMNGYTAKTMPVRTVLSMPSGAIEKFFVEAWVDSTIIVGSNPIIPSGRMSFQWNNYFDRSNRDSIMITDINIEDTPVDLMEYHLTLHAFDRFGNYACTTIRSASWGSYWVTFSMTGDFPSIEIAEMSTEELTFDIDGIGDVYLVSLTKDSGLGFDRVWRAITTEKSVTLPLLPGGESLLEPLSSYNYRVSAIVDPDFSIDDPYIINIVEDKLSGVTTFESEDVNSSSQSFSF